MTSSPLSTDLPSFADVEDAARQISSEAIRTPLLESALLNEEAGRRLLVKPECLQRTGSFKFRGAHNRISRMSADERARGVIAFSSGNHAQGVAHAARICGIAATIIMPEDAPKLKLANTRAYGAEVVTYDRFGESREEIGSEIAERTGAVMVKPYDDFHVIAGQGTCGLEIAEQCAEREIVPDAVVVCCGGGGLTSGISLALEARLPDTRLYAAEPEQYDDWRLSLEKGERVAVNPGFKSICDAIITPMPGAMTFPIAAPRLAGGLVVTDAEVKAAMSRAFDRLKIVIEPGGAVALATALGDQLPADVKTVVVTASGGNVDQAVFQAALADVPPASKAAR